MKRRLAVVVTLAVVVGLTATTGTAASAQSGPPSGVSWQSAGDSYSSGEGVYGNTGACAQSIQAYGPSAARALDADGWQFSSTTFTACTGHLIEDYFTARSDADGKESLWEWGRDQGGPERVDIITMSFGGNDIGFADVLTACLPELPSTWGAFPDLGPVAPNCDQTEADLEARVDALADPPRRDCEGTRRSGDAGFQCDLDIGGRRGSIIDFYYDIATQRLTERGRLYVVGYPRLFADVDQWPAWSTLACQGITRGDAEMLGRVSERFNNRLQDAVRRANQAVGSERVVFVDRFAAYRDGQHELCGRGDDWLNGIAENRGDGVGFRVEQSFHPNTAGHDGTTPLVVAAVKATFPAGAAAEPGAGAALDRNGFGPIRLGMSRDDAVATGLVASTYYEFTKAREGYDCGVLTEPDHVPDGSDSDLSALYLDTGVAYVEITTSAFPTALGPTVGAPIEDFLAILGQPTSSEPDQYEGPAVVHHHFLEPDGGGWRVTTDASRNVIAVRVANDDALSLGEGCA